ncbi:tyrosine recombinase XerD [Clostridia bacterium]|nr:tyrosine recombinase XerD [Clostridia bacterium]
MSSFIDEFKNYLEKGKKLAAGSVEAYCRDINEFYGFVAENSGNDIKDTVQADIAAYLLKLRQDNRSGSTINRKMASLRIFFKFMYSEAYTSGNPALGIRVPKVNRREIEYLTLSEVERLLDQPDDSTKGIRDKAILELMYATGMRVSEVIEANVEHLNLRMGFITCTGEHGKARIIPLGRPARAALEEYIYAHRAKILRGKDDDKALFLNYSGGRMSRQGLWKILKEYAIAAGIKKNITPQILRNSFAVHMLQNGADLKSLQELMGHEDMAATQVYLNVSRNHIKDVYDQAHPRAR